MGSRNPVRDLEEASVPGTRPDKGADKSAEEVKMVQNAAYNLAITPGKTRESDSILGVGPFPTRDSGVREVRTAVAVGDPPGGQSVAAASRAVLQSGITKGQRDRTSVTKICTTNVASGQLGVGANTHHSTRLAAEVQLVAELFPRTSSMGAKTHHSCPQAPATVAG